MTQAGKALCYTVRARLLLLLLLLLQGTSPTHGVVGLLESSLCSQPDTLPDRRLDCQPGPLQLVLGASASGHCMVSGLHLTSELQDLPPFSCLATQLHISRSAICIVVHFSPAATFTGPCPVLLWTGRLSLCLSVGRSSQSCERDLSV